MRLPTAARPPVAILVAGSLFVILAGGLALAAYQFPPPPPQVLLPAGIALLGIVTLAVVRYEAAVAFGFLVFGFVTTDPALPDVVFAVIFSVAVVTGRFRVDRVPLLIVSLAGLYLALNLLSIVEAPDPTRAVYFVAITLYVVLLSIWLAAYVDSQQRARNVVLPYIAGAAISAALGLVALLLHAPGHDLLVYSAPAAEIERARALFDDPNVFGPFLIPAVLILLEELVQPRILRLGAWIKAGLVSLMALAILFSFSRGAWLNLGVGVLVLLGVLALRGRGRMSVGVLATFLIAAGITIAVMQATGLVEIAEQRAGAQTYDVERFGAQRAGIDLAEQHPFGIGPGQFEIHSPVSAHSLYVRAVAEQGILGLATLLAVLIATLVFGIRNAVMGRHTYGIGSAALLAAWCGLLASSVFVDTIHWRHLWFVAALIWAGAMRSRSTGNRAPIGSTV